VLIIKIAIFKLLANVIANAVTDNSTFREKSYLDIHAN